MEKKSTTFEKLSGCVLETALPKGTNLLTLYYLKDNQIFHTIKEGLLNKSFPELQLLNSVPTNQGVYQCAVLVKDVGYVKSDPIGVQFEGKITRELPNNR